MNLEKTATGVSFSDMPAFFRKQLCQKVDREPPSPLPVLPFSRDAFLKPQQGWKLAWFGHNVLLLRIAGLTVLIDPMFGANAAPISPVGVRRFSRDTIEIIDSLPEVDLVLLTHDHYDHLDYESIRRLRPRARRYAVPLGVGRHLLAWGVPEDQVEELDWWQQTLLGELRLTFTPSRHFSGRGLTDRARSLWGGWVLTTEREKVWLSGDGGYGTHFATIGERLGPFDFAFVECGQYNEMWHPMHMYPEEGVRAALDAGAKLVMPIHWGAFSLAQHSWYEPVERFLTEAQRLGLPCITPRLGEMITAPAASEPVAWWRNHLSEASHGSAQGRR